MCLTLRDRIQTEQQYSVELVITPICQSIDSLLHLINRSSVCLFCATKRMKSDNLSHFVYRYLSMQSHRMLLFTILLEQDCELDGNWLSNITLITTHSVLKQIRRHLKSADNNEVRLPSRISDISSGESQRELPLIDELQNQSRHYMSSPVANWSSEDVIEWCEGKKGSFDSLQPLMMRLNGLALIHLAELLAIDPASMYYRLNDELLQRANATLPLTEYVSLSSELQELLLQRENQPVITNVSSPVPDQSRKKRWRKSRFCTLF